MVHDSFADSFAGALAAVTDGEELLGMSGRFGDQIVLCSSPARTAGSGRHIRITRALVYRQGHIMGYRVAVLEQTPAGNPALAREAFHLQLDRAASGSGMPETAFLNPAEADYAWRLACPAVCTGHGSLNEEGPAGERPAA